MNKYVITGRCGDPVPQGMTILYEWSTRSGIQSHAVYVAERVPAFEARQFLFDALRAYATGHPIPYSDGSKYIVIVDPGAAGRVIGRGGAWIKILSRCIGSRVEVRERTHAITEAKEPLQSQLFDANDSAEPLIYVRAGASEHTAACKTCAGKLAKASYRGWEAEFSCPLCGAKVHDVYCGYR